MPAAPRTTERLQRFPVGQLCRHRSLQMHMAMHVDMDIDICVDIYIDGSVVQPRGNHYAIPTPVGHGKDWFSSFNSRLDCRFDRHELMAIKTAI